MEAIPSEELTFSWFKNGRPLRSSERMVITQTDPDVSPGTTNLDIIDLKFTDFGTYTCVASLKGGGISDISIDVNISSSTGKEVFFDIGFTSIQPSYGFPLLREKRSMQSASHHEGIQADPGSGAELFWLKDRSLNKRCVVRSPKNTPVSDLPRRVLFYCQRSYSFYKGTLAFI